MFTTKKARLKNRKVWAIFPRKEDGIKGRRKRRNDIAMLLHPHQYALSPPHQPDDRRGPTFRAAERDQPVDRSGQRLRCGAGLECRLLKQVIQVIKGSQRRSS